MRPLRILFGFRGRLGRPPFVVALLAVLAGFVLLRQLVRATEFLQILAEIFAPHGINGAFVQNGILALLWFIGVWMVLALTAKRLHDRGFSVAWAALALLPLVALVMLNDEIILVSSRFVLPSEARMGVLMLSTALGIWVLIQTLALPGEDR